ncbi:MAG: M14 family metallopeptidase [Nitrospinales bacterium]
MKLNIFDAIPEGLVNVPPHEIGSILPGPSLIQVKGNAEPPLFVATLLHGNETTGFLALQKLLKHYQGKKQVPPRSLNIFLGNIEAAASGQRRLPGQPDYNRIWNGGPLQEHKLMEEVIARAKNQGVFASIDIHNSSGKNPHYACVNKLDPAFIQLARLFSKTLVYFNRPYEVQSRAFSHFCPAVVLEGGQPGDADGVKHVLEYLEQCLALPLIPESEKANEGCEIFHTIAQIKVPNQSHIGFSKNCKDLDFCFIDNFDQLNFSELPENALLGWRFNANLKLCALDETGKDVGDNFFLYKEDEIRLKRSAVPSLFTTDEKIVHQDCLGYLMQRYALL